MERKPSPPELQKLTEKKTESLYKRVEYESHLLNSRTGIVLTLNGLMAVAVGMTPLPAASRIVIATLIIIVNALWITCSHGARHLIDELFYYINKSAHTPVHCVVYSNIEWSRFRIKSTLFLSVIVPFLLLLGWIIGLVLSIQASNKTLESDVEICTASFCSPRD